MSIVVRPSNQRGHAHHGWLESYHTFSFANYYDPAHMGFGPLRVINDDRVQGGGGFPPHAHRNMEILSYVIDGGLEHRDSMGSGSVIRPGDVQVMSAGTGVRHSEFNASEKDPVRFLQIWIEPDTENAKPRYGERNFSPEQRLGQLRLIASRDGRDHSLPIHQDADVFATLLEPGKTVTHTLAAGRKGWVQIATGSATLNGVALAEGDGAAIEDVGELTLATETPGTQALVFDLP
jgi:quercetin 2,3-dioxygenase